MEVADLAPEILERIKKIRFDRIYEKHEGPWDWSWEIDYAEFIAIGGYDVLLPIDKDHYENITILRCIPSKDDQTLTIFFKDTTYSSDWHDAGYLAICEKMSGTDFYIGTVYHEWFIVQNEGLL